MPSQTTHLRPNTRTGRHAACAPARSRPICAALGAVVLAACGQFAAAAGAAESTPAAPALPAAATTAPTGPPPAADSAAPSSVAPGGRSTVSAEYIIGPGDTIQVFVWRSPELSVTVPVRPDGKISTPLVEDVVAVGKTPTELARTMEAVLGAYIRSPQVNIIVTNALSAFSQITVVGQIAKPQTIAYKAGMTVMDVVLAVGGLTNFASGNRAKILRKDPGGKEIQIKVRLQDLLEKGKMSENVAVRPGDVLVVPESIF